MDLNCLQDGSKLSAGGDAGGHCWGHGLWHGDGQQVQNKELARTGGALVLILIAPVSFFSCLLNHLSCLMIRWTVPNPVPQVFLCSCLSLFSCFMSTGADVSCSFILSPVYFVLYPY